jgi:LPXTG-motif cell wall-anchored protein
MTVDQSAIETQGHSGHTGPVFPAPNWGDIIPPFPGFPGMNWTTEGQAIFNNDCQPVTTTTTTTSTTSGSIPPDSGVSDGSTSTVAPGAVSSADDAQPSDAVATAPPPAGPVPGTLPVTGPSDGTGFLFAAGSVLLIAGAALVRYGRQDG